MSGEWHPELKKIIGRHRDFYAGKRDCLVKIYIPDDTPPDELVPEPRYDGLDWDAQFTDYYASRVKNGVVKARRRLEKKLGDDHIPSYHPVFGAGIHSAMFGSELIFMGGTSYIKPPIKNAGEHHKLKINIECKWMKRLAEGMKYCAENGSGVLAASLRGGNAPMDLANGIMGDVILTELLDDPENMRKVMGVCADACGLAYELQKKCASNVMGGFIAGHADLWMPEPMFGHISVDASLLTGPDLYDEFEKKHIEDFVKKHGGFMVHTHMMGWRMLGAVAKTRGAEIIFPVNDPNADKSVARLTEILNAVGDRILVIQIENSDDLKTALNKLDGRKRIVFLVTASDTDDALRKMEAIGRRYTI